jgi:urocanate hydratase
LEEVAEWTAAAQENKIACAIAYHGNIVDLLEFLLEKEVQVDLLTDQTSCHVPYEGGYCPQGLDFKERTRMLTEEKERFKELINKTLRHHYELICRLTEKGTYFFDYGNSFMKSVLDAGVVSICKNGRDETEGFVFPSYVEDILGPQLFDYGYGPFRWVCLSGKEEDLTATDLAAMSCIDVTRRYQDLDNYNWVRDAAKNKMVVGTKARILYQDAMGRTRIALKFNEMVRGGEIGPVMLGRDHHDTGGTDSPFRETSNIKDGSNIMADMATQCFAGNAARGMSMIALHNGGGVGIGKAINGGFGMVLDGSERVDTILKMAMPWDTMVGVSRRAWARNANSLSTCVEYNHFFGENNHITLPYLVSDSIISKTTGASLVNEQD